MADLTSPDTLRAFLSPFWSMFFQDSQAIYGMLQNDAYELQQIYVNFLEAMGNVSIGSLEPFHKELITPIILRASSFSIGPDELKFGAGSDFGPQPQGTNFRSGAVFTYGGLEQLSGLYYIGVPPNFANTASTIFNRLTDPSVMLVRDSDFIFENGVIVFKNNPFENPLIPQRTVAGANGQPEQELVLWAVDCKYDYQRVYEQYGYFFFPQTNSSEAFKKAVQILMQAYSNGPTFQILDALVAVLCGQPIIREVLETVQKITTYGAQKLVITDLGVYTLPTTATLRPNILPGAQLAAGTPLTTAAQVFDQTRTPGWWSDLPGLVVGDDFVALDINSLGFMNVSVQVQPEVAIVTDTATIRPAQFLLAGAPADVKAFWDAARAAAVDAGAGLGDLLWQRAGLVNDEGDSDFTQPLFLNPLQTLLNDLIGQSLLVVRLQISQIDQTKAFISQLSFLRQIVPAWISLIVMVEFQLSDDYSFQRTDGQGVEITQLNLQGTAALITGNVSDFTGDTETFWTAVDSNGVPLTKTPEALSVDDTPATTLSNILDLGNPANNSASYGSGIAVVTELVQGKLIDSCKP